MDDVAAQETERRRLGDETAHEAERLRLDDEAAQEAERRRSDVETAHEAGQLRLDEVAAERPRLGEEAVKEAERRRTEEAVSQVAAEEIERPRYPPIESLCSQGHGLLHVCSVEAYECDNCEAGILRETFLDCKVCDWALCGACGAMSPVERESAAMGGGSGSGGSGRHWDPVGNRRRMRQFNFQTSPP